MGTPVKPTNPSIISTPKHNYKYKCMPSPLRRTLLQTPAADSPILKLKSEHWNTDRLLPRFLPAHQLHPQLRLQTPEWLKNDLLRTTVQAMVRPRSRSGASTLNNSQGLSKRN